MRKVAFILAIALVFLFGETTVLKQKNLAMEKKVKKQMPIVLWIPINQLGEPVLSEIKPEKGKDFKGTKLPLPISVGTEKWKTIDNIENATVMKITKNPLCFVICNRGD